MYYYSLGKGTSPLPTGYGSLGAQVHGARTKTKKAYKILLTSHALQFSHP